MNLQESKLVKQALKTLHCIKSCSVVVYENRFEDDYYFDVLSTTFNSNCFNNMDIIVLIEALGINCYLNIYDNDKHPKFKGKVYLHIF